MSVMTPHEALIACRDAAGSDSALARDLSEPNSAVSQPRVWRWINKAKLMPAEFVIKAERLYGISRHIIRPDIYPVETDAAHTPRCTGVGQRAEPCESIVDAQSLRVAFNSQRAMKGAAA